MTGSKNGCFILISAMESNNSLERLRTICTCGECGAHDRDEDRTVHQ